jgi:pimeloyl-ACP methyl ester carboxylesterase
MDLIISCLILTLISSCGSYDGKGKQDSITIKEKFSAMKSGYAVVNGLNMYYEIYGEGTPLVLVHGGGSTIQTSFGRVIPELSKHRQIIAMELQAHGRTGDREAPESFEQDADDVAALLKFLQIERVDLFGFSNGANTTMQVAIRHPELVRKIILGSGFYKREGMPPEFWDGISRASLADMPIELQNEYKKVAPDTNGLIRMFTKDKKRMVEFKDWSEDVLRSIKVPTLIIASDRDVMKPEHTLDMHRLIAQSQLIILPGVHGEYIGEITTLPNGAFQAKLIVPMLENFLDQ